MRKAKWRQASEQQQLVAKGIEEGQTIQGAMLAAGYSEARSRLGLNGLPKTVLALLGKNSGLVELGRISAGTRADMIRGRLMWNVAHGKDGGAASAKIAGSDKDLNLWVSEQNVNQVIIQIPEKPEEK